MRHIPNPNHKHVQNTQTNPVHYHINPIIQIIPNDDRVGHAMASWPGAWKPKAHACMPQKVAPQWHVNPVRHMHFPAAAPAPAESVAKGLSSGETTSTTAPRDHHTRRRGTLEGRRGGRFWRHTCRLLLVQVTIALGVGVQRVGAAKEAAAVGAQVVALLPPPLLLLNHGRRTKSRERKKYDWVEVGWGDEKRRAEGIKKAWRKGVSA